VSVNQLPNCEYVVVMTMDANLYGPPSDILLHLDFSNTNNVKLSLNWYNKTTTRLPEAFWFSFLPIASNQTGFTIDKVGVLTPALGAVVNGSAHLHGHWSGVYYSSKDGNFSFEALDSGIVSIGLMSPFPTPFTTPNPLDGIHFNLFNNIWDTNYPLWFPFLEEDTSMIYRFQINV